MFSWASPGSSNVKESACNVGDLSSILQALIPGPARSLELYIFFFSDFQMVDVPVVAFH